MTKLVVGLGNPGTKYAHTFHNLGFIAIDKAAGDLGIKFGKKECKAVTAEAHIDGNRLILAKPTTYMNLSGESLRELVGRYEVELKDLLVIVDDIDIPRHSLRIRKSGSAGTHNGMRSIVEELGEGFGRIRIGVGAPPPQIPLVNFVLMPIPTEWREDYMRCFESVSQAVKLFGQNVPIEEIGGKLRFNQ